jgi:FlaA1/EpsC-like NDP-sugar epimerase
VLLYGAGKVGKEYYYQLKAENKYNVIGIVDRNAGKIESDFKVLDLNDVRQMKFDYVIIAVAQEEMAEQIKFELEKLNVPKRKMIWEKPITVFEYFR